MFAGDTTCALTEPLDAGGTIAYDDSQSGHATARGRELVVGVPTRMYADRKATVVLDEGRWSARVTFTEDAPIPTCA